MVAAGGAEAVVAVAAHVAGMADGAAEAIQAAPNGDDEALDELLASFDAGPLLRTLQGRLRSACNMVGGEIGSMGECKSEKRREKNKEEKKEEGGIAGSLTVGNVSKIEEALTYGCNLNKQSVVCDLGCGMGRTVMQFAVMSQARVFGYELHHVNCLKFETVKRFVMESDMLGSRVSSDPYVVCQNFKTLNSALTCPESGELVTHVYSFCEGMPAETMQSIARLVNMSHLHGLALVMRSYPNIRQQMSSWGFQVEKLQLVKKFTVNQHGGQGQFQAYVFAVK